MAAAQQGTGPAEFRQPHSIAAAAHLVSVACKQHDGCLQRAGAVRALQQHTPSTQAGMSRNTPAGRLHALLLPTATSTVPALLQWNMLCCWRCADAHRLDLRPLGHHQRRTVVPSLPLHLDQRALIARRPLESVRHLGSAAAAGRCAAAGGLCSPKSSYPVSACRQGHVPSSAFGTGRRRRAAVLPSRPAHHAARLAASGSQRLPGQSEQLMAGTETLRARSSLPELAAGLPARRHEGSRGAPSPGTGRLEGGAL